MAPVPGLRLTRLSLTGFRNYADLSWRLESPSRDGAVEPNVVVLHGPNGSGKTNLLEAISLLMPGRGLRGARIGDLARRGGGGSWAVAARFATRDGPLDVGTGTAPDGPAERRMFRLDGAPPRNQAEIAVRVASVWLTPQMDRLFQEGASGRRRFLDRLAFALEPGHAREVAAHDAAMTQRNRLLADGGADPAWLAGLEDAMARHGVAATATRAALVARLTASLAAGAIPGFPAAAMTLLCPIADRLAASPALAAEDWLRETLRANRMRDAAAGTAAFGAHRADMALSDVATGLGAAEASTGQQKALLIGVILGHAALLAEARGFAPLLLLDEPAVHLDAERRAALFSALAALPAQSFVTGTDVELFSDLRAAARSFRTGDGRIIEDRVAGS